MKNRQRKFLMVLPLLIIPFLTMAFWALGGGKGNAAITTADVKGINTTMPKAVLKDEKGYNKMSFYEEAMTDSLKIKEREKNDPFYFRKKDTIPTLSNLSKFTDPNEEKVYQKLAELNTAMHPQEPAPQPVINNNSDINRLEQLMHGMKEQNEDDTEMQRLSAMMDKIIAIQHPETIKDTVKPRVIKEVNVVALKDSTAPEQVGFYSLDDEATLSSASNVIRATIPETQTIVTGSTIKLLLNDAIVVKGTTIPANTFVYGTVSMNNERLKITLASVRAGNTIIPVSLEVYDMDGLAGIYVPGSINRDVAKQSTDEAVNSMGLSTLDPSLGAQAASAGIQAAKSLISKKVKLVKVTVKAGYQIFLKQIN